MVFIFTQIFSVRQGRAVFTLAGFPTLEYLNLPYGVATRFLPATRAPAWQGVRDGTQLGQICSQVETIEFNNFEILSLDLCTFFRYWGNSYKRLLTIKKFWDPNNIFNYCHSVGSTEENCCAV